MASQKLKKRLNELVEMCGSDRRAVRHIKRVKGAAPSHSNIHRARMEGTGTDYTILCYIQDIEASLSVEPPVDWQNPKWCEALSKRTAICLAYYALFESKAELRKELNTHGSVRLLKIRNFGKRSLDEITLWLS
ncbi:hypothetical protein [Pseudoalteromonas luteoviolacea]|nr:hypothetical protein [Pseudoalteromonas luteoviolacea]